MGELSDTVNVGDLLRDFDRTLTTLVANGPEQARPFAKAWLAVVRVPAFNLEGYLRTTHHSGPPEIKVVPVVGWEARCVIDAFGYFCRWNEGAVAVSWTCDVQDDACVLVPNGEERVVTTRVHGAVIAAFPREKDGFAWAEAKAAEFYATHVRNTRRG